MPVVIAVAGQRLGRGQFDIRAKTGGIGIGQVVGAHLLRAQGALGAADGGKDHLIHGWLSGSQRLHQ
jgi:hypothetical protein